MGEGGFLWRSCLLLAVLGGQGQGRDVPGQQSVTSTQSPSPSGHSAPEGQCPIPKAHPLPPPCPRHSWIQMLRVRHRIPPAPKQDPMSGQSLPPALHGLTSADTAQPQLELPEGREGRAKGAARRHQLGVTVSCCCLTPKCKPIQSCPKNQTSTLLEPRNKIHQARFTIMVPHLWKCRLSPSSPWQRKRTWLRCILCPTLCPCLHNPDKCSFINQAFSTRE